VQLSLTIQVESAIALREHTHMISNTSDLEPVGNAQWQQLESTVGACSLFFSRLQLAIRGA